MDGFSLNNLDPQQLGEEWIRAVVEKDFQRLTRICFPDVRSRLMTPRHVHTLENVTELTQQVETWFAECSSVRQEQAHVGMVGEKLAIFYRLRFVEEGVQYTAEQQIYCSVQNGRIEKLSLLCSGFQPVQPPVDRPMAQPAESAAASNPSAGQPAIQAHALLEIAAGGRESTCAILTPSIKHKLAEINSGQVLEVHVDDPTAMGDIEAWCRLSGNTLLQMDQGTGQELRFYLMKK